MICNNSQALKSRIATTNRLKAWSQQLLKACMEIPGDCLNFLFQEV